MAPSKETFLGAWLAFLKAHSRVVPQVGQELMESCGISLTWYDVLFQLDAVPGHRMRMHELADAIVLSKSGLTRVVDRMEQAGLVTREAVAGDRRSSCVVVTPAGRALVSKARPIVKRSVWTHFGSPLSESELIQVRDALRRLAGG